MRTIHILNLLLMALLSLQVACTSKDSLLNSGLTPNSGKGNGKGFDGEKEDPKDSRALVRWANSKLFCEPAKTSFACRIYVLDSGVPVPAVGFADGITANFSLVGLDNETASAFVCSTKDSGMSYSCQFDEMAFPMLLSVGVKLEIRDSVTSKMQSSETDVVLTKNIPFIPGAFVTVWKTDNTNPWSTTTNNQISLPLVSSGLYQFSVDWGDGTNSTINSYNEAAVTHTYAIKGTYLVAISGTLQGFSFNSSTALAESEKLLLVSQWGPLRLGNTGGYFMKAKNLKITATDFLDLSGITDLSGTFYGCESLTQVPNINSWDVSAVTSMQSMFYLSAFNGDISDWDVGNVTQMDGMFYGNTSFNQDISKWNVSKVTNMARMFGNANTFNQNISNWDTSKVTDMSQMFILASSFNQDLSHWNVSSVTNMNKMFYQASSFNQNISAWNVVNVTDMGYMFAYAAKFNQAIGGWNVSNVTDMRGMFSWAVSFNQSLASWNVSKVTSMREMFSYSFFNQNLNTWDVSNVTDMSQMFFNDTAFNGSILGWNVAKVKSMNSMFNRASSFNQDISSWNVTSVLDMNSMFALAREFNQDLSSWNVGSVTDMQYMFSDASKFNKSLSLWNVANVTSMFGMFQRATSFNQDLSNWNVGNVTSMNSMFFGAASFDQNLGAWNVSKVTSMRGMFVGARLSTANYNALLNGWAARPLKNGVKFDAGNATYSSGSPAALARLAIINNFGWTITDGGAI